ncbi:MAG TPA: multicopper oxidase domain-containing protein [Mycobacteriales bacterium]|nr:multicopper oxidase domain-containing protein [Mycobacteriales bacterium]
MRIGRTRGLVAAFVLILGLAGYVGEPLASGATAPQLTSSVLPAASGALSGAVVVGPGGASTGYYTKVSLMTAGSTLSFVNLDELAHTVTSVARKPDGTPLFNGNALPGKTVQVEGASKLPAGTYPFYCQFHPNMTGTLIVEGKGNGGPIKQPPPTFPQPLRIPKVLTGSHITIPVEQANVRVLPHGPKTQMWTYGGSYPGPTIVRPAGHRTSVTFVNKLPHYVGDITVHLHGDHHSSASDGQPDSDLIKPGSRRTYVYPLTDHGKPEPPAFDFYHDHRMGFTTRNNWNGMQGMFEVTSAKEKSLHLPSGRYDVPLMVNDRSFDNLNQLTEPFTSSTSLLGANSPPGDATVGSDVLVNGVYRPHFDVKARSYRLRLLNDAAFSSYDFELTGGLSFTQIGTGDSLLPKPVVRKDIVLGPAQRADVIVNFAHAAHHRVVLKSVPRVGGAPEAIGTQIAPIMQFRVGGRTADPTHLQAKLPSVAPIKAASVPTGVWVFGLGGSIGSGLTWTVNGEAYDPKRIDMTVRLGSTQTWLLVNLSTITHYIHIHEEQWHTIQVNGSRPPPWEQGLVDTWEIDPGQSVEVAAKVTDYTGVFMLHCHMLDHEDHGMMAQFAVTKTGSSSLPLALRRSGYYLARGDATPTALARLPLRDALHVAADTAAGVRPDARMRAMGMAGMQMPAATATRSASPWPAVVARLARTAGVGFALAQLCALLAWRRGRIRRPRSPVGLVVRSVRS